MSEQENAKPGSSRVATGWLREWAPLIGMCITVLASLVAVYSAVTRKTIPESSGLERPVRLSAHLRHPGSLLIPEGIDPVQVDASALEDRDSSIMPTLNADRGSSLVLEISSRAAEETVAVEPSLLFRVERYSAVPDWTDIYAPLSGWEPSPPYGPGYYRNFVVTLDWSGNPETQYTADFAEDGYWGLGAESPRPPELDEQRVPDFFTLTPGELEKFIVELRFAKPGEYDLLLGVEYSYEGRSDEEWLDDPVSVYVPGNHTVWYSWQGETNAYQECEFEPAARYLCEWVQAIPTAAQLCHPVFLPLVIKND